MNVSTLRSVLPTKFATSSSSLALHRSLGQKQDKFQAYKANLEMNLDALSTSNPFLATSSSSLPLHRSLGQKQGKFQAYKANLEMNLDALSTSNPFLISYDRQFQCKIKQLVFK